jgi:glycosyltransferase involved in cell wall biosynthesis
MMYLMKVGLLVPSYGLDAGVSTPVIRTLAEALGHEVDLHVFPLRYPKTRSHVTHDNLRLHAPGGSGMSFRRLVFATVRLIAAEHRRGAFDLLHAIWLHEPGSVALAAGKLLRVPVVVSIGGAEVANIPSIAYGGMRSPRGRIMHRWALRQACIVTGGSRYVIERMLHQMRHPPATVRLAPLPVNARAFETPARPRRCDPNAPQLFHAASLIPVKDQQTLLRAFRMILDEIPGARLTIAGEDPFGHWAGLERLRDELGLRRSVTFLGHVEHGDMPALYARADAFLLSSLHESQGMVVLEAAASGVPTVGTAVGAVADLAPDCAIAVPIRDASAIARETCALLRDPSRLHELGESARRRVEDVYAVGPAVTTFMKLYADAITGFRR